jgi:hypothetical protein
MQQTMIERYVVRKDHEWAIFYIDEEMGSFVCQSSYGTYANIWRHIGDRTLKQFLAGLNFDYFMGKARPDYQRFDRDKSVENVKDAIIQCRRRGDCDRETARHAWDDIEVNDNDNGVRFCDEVARSDDLLKILGSEYYEYARESADGDSRHFWKVIWPEFVKKIDVRQAA